MSVEHIGQRNVDTAKPEESAFQAAERMHQRTVGALVVVDGDNTPIGIVTDRDLAIRVVAAGRDPYTTTVRDVMTRAPRTATVGTSVEAALSLMETGCMRRLPIVEAGGRLAGLVTLDDILMLFADDQSRVGRLLKRETPQAAAESLSKN